MLILPIYYIVNVYCDYNELSTRLRNCSLSNNFFLILNYMYLYLLIPIILYLIAENYNPFILNTSLVSVNLLLAYPGDLHAIPSLPR